MPFARTRALARGCPGRVGVTAALLGSFLIEPNAARAQAPKPTPPAVRPAAPATVPTLPSAVDPTMIRDGFESARTVWNQEQTDATIHLLEHDRSRRAAHEGRVSEHFRFTAALGSGFYFSDTLPKVPVTDALKASLFVRANRAGVQLFARVVLPADTDPETKQPSFLLVPGTSYDDVDRWQRLEVVSLRPALERQARVLRASTRRPVSLEGAYVERLVVNLYTGTGETEVFLDELVIGPVPPALVAGEEGDAPAEPPAVGAAATTPAAATPTEKTTASVRLDRNRLKKRAQDGLYYDLFPTAIDAPGADIAALRNAGFDVLIDDLGADQARFTDAVKRGFLLLPRVSLASGGEADPEAEADRVFAAASAFPQREAVLAWSLGEHLGRAGSLDERKQQLDAVRMSISKLKTLPTNVSRLTTGVIDDDLPRFTDTSRKLHLLGIRPLAWGGSQQLMSTVLFLKQRRDLALLGNAGALFWAELPAAAPPEVTRAIWGLDVPPAWGNPIVQPEQLRQMTYAALAAGYRGIAYKGDAELTRSAGRMALLEMALLNAEIDLCESILANGADPIPLYKAYPNDPPVLPAPGQAAVGAKLKRQKEFGPLGDLRSAAIGTRDRKGVLLIAADYAWNSQFQPPQLAQNDVNITVIVPEGAQAFEISPGQFNVVDKRERTVGGTRLRIPEFDTSMLLLVTTDVEMAQRVEAVVNALAPRAAAMAIEQAELKLQWVTDINGRLAADGHYLVSEKDRKKRDSNGGQPSTDQADLLRMAAKNIATARENQERLDFAAAWAEARRASRPLRLLMNELWKNADEALQRANTPPEELAKEEQIKLGRFKRVGPPRRWCHQWPARRCRRSARCRNITSGSTG